MIMINKNYALYLPIFAVIFIIGCVSNSPDYSNTIITMERTMCYGTCPEYNLTIYPDGAVIYEGHSNVNVTGRQVSEIPQEKIKELVDEFYAIGFFSLKDKYTGEDEGVYVSDLPSTTTSITVNGQTKSVLDYYGTPQKLKNLENKIDEITNSKQWVEGV